MIHIIEVLEKPSKESSLYRLSVKADGTCFIHYCDEENYQRLLAETEIYTLLHSKGCSKNVIKGIFERIATLQSLSHQDGISQGIKIGYEQISGPAEVGA